MMGIFESQFGKVIGGSEEEKEKGLKKYERLLNDPSEDIEKKYKRYEIQKSGHDLALIAEAESGVDAMAKEWGGDPKPIPPEKIHIVKENSVPIISGKRFELAYHQSSGQSVVVEQGKSKIKFMQSLAHELFHQKSYKSAQAYDRRETIKDYISRRRGTKLYRSGLQMVDRKNPKAQPGEEDIYFSQLEEAIVATSTHMFLARYISNDPRYKDAFIRGEKVKAWMQKIPEMFPGIERGGGELKYIYALEGEDALELVNVLEGPEENDYKLGFLDRKLQELYKDGLLIHADRIPEIEKMDELIERLITASNGKIGTKKEAFNLFARANFSGNILTLGKTIERYLGRGMFRKIGEDLKDAGKKRGILEQFKELFSS